MDDAITRFCRGCLIPISALVLIELYLRIWPTSSDNIVPPSLVMLAVREALFDGTFAATTLDTLKSAFGGLFIGSAFGLVLGVATGMLPWLRHSLDTSIEIVRPIPSITLIPVAMLIFGLGYKMEIAIVAFACTWPMLILSRAAVEGVEPQLIEVGRILGLSNLSCVFKLLLPSIIPRLFVALRLTTALSLVVAITVEIAANPVGLGYAMMTAQQSVRPDLMYAFLVWIALLGWLLNFLMQTSERLLFWKYKAA